MWGLDFNLKSLSAQRIMLCVLLPLTIKDQAEDESRVYNLSIYLAIGF
jgi:hypothetical protein